MRYVCCLAVTLCVSVGCVAWPLVGNPEGAPVTRSKHLPPVTSAQITSRNAYEKLADVNQELERDAATLSKN